MELMDTNAVKLAGTIATPPAFSHEAHGHDFYTCMLAVRRLSGSEDILRIQVPEMRRRELVAGERVALSGHMRSYNNRSGTGSRLVLSVLLREWGTPTGEDINDLRLTGTLCKPPIYRKTPLGREISDLLVAVSRGRGRSDYMPCICWGAAARRAAEFKTGDRVELPGRVQSREYTKLEDGAEVKKTAYEISAAEIFAI
ncbi:single-strand DNA-binding protein [Clostridia bacterium]|nr:single-strand DNA-binding protein [Clostridia bacterium]